jgi:hypothetical protein
MPSVYSSNCTEDFCLVFFEVTYTSFFTDKKSQNSRNQGFSYWYCLMMGGSVSLTNGSGSGRPKTYGSGYGTLLLSDAEIYFLPSFAFTCLMVIISSVFSSLGKRKDACDNQLFCVWKPVTGRCAYNRDAQECSSSCHYYCGSIVGSATKFF